MKKHLAILWIGFSLVLTSVAASAHAADNDDPVFNKADYPTEGKTVHGLAMHGEPKYPADYPHFDYVDPEAPKGGMLRIGVSGSFNSFNPFVIKGNSFAMPGGGIYESLLIRSTDEAFSVYGLLAESIDTPEDRSWAAYTLREGITFADGHPLTVDDVVFTLELLSENVPGQHKIKKIRNPRYKWLGKKILHYEITGPRTIKVYFNRELKDRELPLTFGLLPILPKHLLDKGRFENFAKSPVIGSGPYYVEKHNAPRSYTLRRNKNYWGKNMPFARGRFNFDLLKFEYYTDSHAIFESFARGDIGIRMESNSGLWASGYNFPSARDGRISRVKFKKYESESMLNLVLNTRRYPFNNKEIRKAFTIAFDFDWINKYLFHGIMKRSSSLFQGTPLSSYGIPASKEELELLGEHVSEVDPDILNGSYKIDALQYENGKPLPHHKYMRRKLRKAYDLFLKNGFKIKNGKMIDTKTGKQLTFNVMSTGPSQTRFILAYTRNLERLGIKVTLDTPDSSVREQRKKQFDFDSFVNWPYTSGSPGSEQKRFFGSAAANEKDARSQNYAGVQSPAVDYLIDRMVETRDKETLITVSRAYDRVLRSGYYGIPLYHLPYQLVAHWKNYAFPNKPVDGSKDTFISGRRGIGLDVWWQTDGQPQSQTLDGNDCNLTNGCLEEVPEDLLKSKAD